MIIRQVRVFNFGTICHTQPNRQDKTCIIIFKIEIFKNGQKAFIFIFSSYVSYRILIAGPIEAIFRR